jgi:phage/plasmid-associated DNA primase
MPKLCGKALKLIPQLLERGSFSKEGNLEQRKSRYQRRSSSVIEFINDYCDQMGGEFITCSDFMESYRDFCKDNGYNEKSDQAIGKEMTDIGYQSIQKRVNGPNTRVYLNLKWKNGVVNSSYLPFDIDI